jgi:peptide/nickel transport system permease protein
MLRRLTGNVLGNVLGRLASGLVIALLGAAAVFFAMHTAAGDPALAALGENATPEAVAAFRHKWRLDEPVPGQFVRWLGDIVQGDAGRSITVGGGVPIAGLIAARLPNTAFIGLYAIALAVLISLVAGSLAALRRGTLLDAAITSGALLGISMPDFWLSYLLVFVFALGLGWFPAFGFVPLSQSPLEALQSAFLPAVAIAAPMAASFTKMLRACLVENLLADHVRAARSFGFGGPFIFVHYIFRNALIPYLTVIGLQVRYLLGGTVVIERIFGIPGIGSLLVDAAFSRDYPVVQACALAFLVVVLLVNLLVDAACAFLNPRTRAA